MIQNWVVDKDGVQFRNEFYLRFTDMLKYTLHEWELTLKIDRKLEEKAVAEFKQIYENKKKFKY